jgi:CBS domain-containing protein
MSAEPIALRAEQSAGSVSKTIPATHHDSLPVSDAEERLRGMLSGADALAALVDG